MDQVAFGLRLGMRQSGREGEGVISYSAMTDHAYVGPYDVDSGPLWHDESNFK